MINNHESSDNLLKIVRISRFVRAVALLGFIIFIVSLLRGGLSLTLSTDAAPELESGIVGYNLQDMIARIPFILSVVGAFYWLDRLFKCFQHGEIFTVLSVKAFKFLSIFIIAIGMNSVLIGLYGGLIGLTALGGSKVWFDINITEASLLWIGLGLVLYALALIQQEAKRQTEDMRLIF